VRDIFTGIWPFIFADVVTLGILTAFPEIVTFITGAGD
jgi:TRAP-type mannitol/chloroaromatic compound transport system permease large subunit